LATLKAWIRLLGWLKVGFSRWQRKIRPVSYATAPEAVSYLGDVGNIHAPISFVLPNTLILQK